MDIFFPFRKMRHLPFILKACRYAAFFMLIRLLVLTLVTAITTRLQTSIPLSALDELMRTYALPIATLSAFLYRRQTPFYPIERVAIESSFFPGFLRGTICAFSIILLSVLSDFHALGTFLPFFEAPLHSLSLLWRCMLITSIMLCEIPLFVPTKPNDAWIYALAFTGIKILQFPISLSQALGIFLLTLALFLSQTFHKAIKPALFGVGFCTAFALFYEVLCSLPLFGTDFSGILLLKFQESRYFITGGSEGPCASPLLQWILILWSGSALLKGLYGKS